MSKEYKQGAEIDFRAAVKLPITATRKQVIEWVEYSTNARSDIKLDNPLRDFDMDAFGVLFTFPR